MQRLLQEEDASGPAGVSTGSLPAREAVTAPMRTGLEQLRAVAYGMVADNTPALARTSPDRSGIHVVEIGGAVHPAGDGGCLFSIQGISKPFVLALVFHELDGGPARGRVGVNAPAWPSTGS